MHAPVRTRRDFDRLMRRSTNYETLPAFHAGRVRTDLGRMRVYVERLSHPEIAVPVVHITGTKGKGSTASLVSRLLGAAGKSVGLHTSPHLQRLEERVMVDFVPIAEPDLFTAANEVIAARAAGEDPGFPTFFEFITLAAFLQFRRRAVAFAVHEVGMGGALDATNVVMPAVAAITNVSLEHTAVLGDTVEAIAAEKAGVIKPRVPVVLGLPAGDPALAPILAAAARVSAPVRQVGRDFRLTRVERRPGGGMVVGVSTPGARYEDLATDLSGIHQAENLAMAIAVIEVLAECGGPRVDAAQVRAALAGFTLPGRLERVWDEPIVLVDGAHTPESIALVVDETRRIHPDRPPVFLFAMAGDKNREAAARALAPAGVVVATGYENPRAAAPADLARLVERAGGRAEAVPDPAAALDRAADLADRGGLVLVVGSLYLAGLVRSRLANRTASVGSKRRDS